MLTFEEASGFFLGSYEPGSQTGLTPVVTFAHIFKLIRRCATFEGATLFSIKISFKTVRPIFLYI